MEQASFPQDEFSFLNYLHQEKLAHKEHRHRHVVQKMLISGAILSLGQLVENPDLIFFVTLLLPFICLVHDIYIFAEHYKVKRIGHFLLAELTDDELTHTHLIKRWEEYLTDYREKYAIWGSLIYTGLVAISAVIIPWTIGIEWTKFYSIAYGLFIGLVVVSIGLVFCLAPVWNNKFEDV